MATSAATSAPRRVGASPPSSPTPGLPGQVVLVLQGGGALGAYQLGVYQAMHEAGIEPDWVVGTSIGAINGALIAGNAPENRMDRLHAFWDRMEIRNLGGFQGPFAALANTWANLSTITSGLPGFFKPNGASLFGQHAHLGIEHAAYYSTEPLRETLAGLIDQDYLDSQATRLTVGAVNARTGAMTYFDSRQQALRVDHVMASGALPPAFPAVRIDGEPYWDGGIYSNTPTEVVLDDNPRRNSVIFSVQLWNPDGAEPDTLWQINGRQKDIQFSSRSTSHVAEQQKIHKLRHIIRELVKHIPEDQRRQAEVAELGAWGCGTTMHLVQLTAPRLEREDHTKDIDFTPSGIQARWAAGHADAQRALAAAPWRQAVDSRDGIVIHDF
ncbi:MAG: patatin-like phospholipase family protein [Rubrivivax sp.]|nr:MAG: patatin-like phospholipase family protein [Rubrivivax sp.]